MTGDIYLFH